MLALAAIDVTVNIILAIRRVPVVFLSDNWLLKSVPWLLIYLIPVEKLFLTLASLVFIIFIGGRHLQTVSFVLCWIILSEHFNFRLNRGATDVSTL